jgi:CDP-diacylglycerol--glycerol-3-phosphate 3-phosphatidyltransferase
MGRIGVTPDALTVLGVVFAAGTALAVASGHVIWGAVGIALSGLGDLLDGNLARSSGRNGRRGSFFDSVTDRVSDALVLGGVAWYVGRTNPHLPVLALTVAALSMLISYERAKAEGLGFQAKGGLMERAERYVLLGVGMAFDVLVPVLWIMLALTAFTAVQRFVRVWRQAERPPPLPRVRRDRRTRASVASGPATPRLRTWFEARATRVDSARRVHPARRRTRP